MTETGSETQIYHLHASEMGNPVGRDDALVETLTLTQKDGSWKLIVLDHHVTLVSWEGVKYSVQGFCCTHLPSLFLCGQGCVRR